MKKIGLFVVLLLLCIGLGLMYFLKGGKGTGVDAADFLPGDVLFYSEQIDFTKMYGKFSESRLGKTLESLDYNGIAAELGQQGQAVLELDRLRKKLNTFFENPAFNELLGKEFSVALFPAKSFATDNPARALEERLLFIARPRHSVHLLQSLIPLFNQEIKHSTAQYGSHIINRYKIDDINTISTVTVKGLIVAALEERLVRKSIDYYDTQKNTLSDNKEFKRLRKSFKGAQLFSYLSLPAFFEQGKMISENLEKEEKKEFLRLLEHWKGWGAAAYGAWHEKGLLKDRVEIFFDQDSLDSNVARLCCDVKPSRNQTLMMVPAEPLFYYWTNTLNLPLIWEIYSTSLTRKKPEALDLLRQELRDVVNVELEEILAMLDKDFALIVKDVEGGSIPLPKVSAIVKLREPDRFMKIFQTLLDEGEIPLSSKKFKKHTITYWGTAPQSGLQPAFVLIDEYLVLSNSIDLVEQIVSLKSDPSKTLFNSKEMKEVGKELKEKNNSAAYVHIARLADALKELATWAGGMASIQGPEAAREADVLVNKFILPLLDGLSMYTKLSSRSIINKDSIILESTTTVIE
jgi:hypothetical protein